MKKGKFQEGEQLNIRSARDLTPDMDFTIDDIVAEFGAEAKNSAPAAPAAPVVPQEEIPAAPAVQAPSPAAASEGFPHPALHGTRWHLQGGSVIPLKHCIRSHLQSLCWRDLAQFQHQLPSQAHHLSESISA